VRDQKSEELTCWQMRDDRSCFDPEEIVGTEDRSSILI